MTEFAFPNQAKVQLLFLAATTQTQSNPGAESASLEEKCVYICPFLTLGLCSEGRTCCWEINFPPSNYRLCHLLPTSSVNRLIINNSSSKLDTDWMQFPDNANLFTVLHAKARIALKISQPAEGESREERTLKAQQ